MVRWDKLVDDSFCQMMFEKLTVETLRVDRI